MRATGWVLRVRNCLGMALLGVALHTAANAAPLALRFAGQGPGVQAKLTAPVTGDFSLEAWVCTAAQAKVQERIVSLAGSGGAVQLCIGGGRFVIDNSGGPSTGVVGSRSLNDGAWHQVVLKRWELTTYALHVDGEFVGQCAGTTPPYTDLYIGLAPGYPAFQGLVDEVRLYDRALTDAEVRNSYLQPAKPVREGLIGWWQLEGDYKDAVGGQDGAMTAAADWVPGRGEALYDHPRATAAFYPWSGRISVDVDARMMGAIPAGATWEVRVSQGAAKAEASVPVPPGCQGQVPVEAAALAPGTYDVQVRVMAQGRPVGQPGAATVAVTPRPAWASKVKVLNNAVLELLSARNVPVGQRRYTFTNPREGFIFLAAPGAGAGTTLALADGKPLLTVKAGDAQPPEAFRYLPPGEHQLAVTVAGKALPQLVVRAIPEIFFEEWLQNHSYLQGFAPRDLAFMQREGLLATSTTLFSHGVQQTPPPGIEDLRAQGRHWITSVPLDVADTAEAMRDRMLSVFQVPSPPNAVGADEIMQFTPARARAIELLVADPLLQGRKLHPYVCSPFPSRGGEEGSRLMRTLMAGGHSPMWERYLSEPADEATAWADFNSQVRAEMKQYWQPLRPDVAENLIMTYGFFSSPVASLNHNPGVDYKVWMDLEMYYLVNDPMFSGLAGFNRWTSGGADEENLRWAARLNRHYLIEGRRDLLSPQYGFKYHLTHLQNPDFADGLSGWEVKPAEPGSITAGQNPYLGELQGRYPATSAGNTFVCLRRSAQAPNVVTQTLRDLVPGKLYSVKLLSSDLGELRQGVSLERRLALRLQLDNVEVLPVNNLQAVYATRWLKVGGFDGTAGRPYWVNYDYRVFRAKATTARLTISDWPTPTEPGGPVGQEIACNFVEVQPYLE